MRKKSGKEPQMLILDEELPFNYLQYNGTTRKRRKWNHNRKNGI